MTAPHRLLPALVLAAFLTACAGGEASDDGTALLRNESGRDDLRVVVRDGADRPFQEAALDPVYRFDTQFTDRERQCLVAGDGSFEVRDAVGRVLVEHDFADRPVCDHDVLKITEDLELAWPD